MTQKPKDTTREIVITIPGWIDKEVAEELFEHVKSLCNLLSNKNIFVSRGW